jgi:hypothetical protein
MRYSLQTGTGVNPISPHSSLSKTKTKTVLELPLNRGFCIAIPSTLHRRTKRERKKLSLGFAGTVILSSAPDVTKRAASTPGNYTKVIMPQVTI